MFECYTCKLTAQRDRGEAPLWDNIFRTDYWDVVHSYNTSLPGWIVLVARRHMVAIDEMSEAEATGLGSLLRRVSLSLKQVLGCEKTYVLQFAEHPQHPHVHFHVVPRMNTQPETHKGPQIMNYLKGPESEYVPEAEMNAISKQIRQVLEATAVQN